MRTALQELEGQQRGPRDHVATRELDVGMVGGKLGKIDWMVRPLRGGGM